MQATLVLVLAALVAAVVFLASPARVADLRARASAILASEVGAVGTGARYMANLPAQPFVIDPTLFFQLTQKNKDRFAIKTWPGFGAPLSVELPHADIIGALLVTFEGNIAGATAGTVDPLWAYKLLSEIKFAGSGKSDLHWARGIDFHVLRFIRNPALNRNVEFYSTAADENGNFRVAWEIPVASDMTTLVGAMWAQSQSQQLKLELRTATLAELDITGAAVVTGDLHFHRTAFSAPFHPEQSGTLVIPDLSRLHGIVMKEINFANTGRVPAALDHLQAIMMRCLTYVDLGSASGASAGAPYDVIAPAVERTAFKFGAKTQPLEYEPAWVLAMENANNYGAILPRGYLCYDFVRENAVRDNVILPGVTDPEIPHWIRAGTVLAANSKIRLVQEVQYIGE